MVGYAMLVGPAPSVVRSTVMTTTFCLAAIAQRLARPANTLSLAALATLMINPMYLFDVGCQLSFLAIGALVWLVSPACIAVRHILETIRGRLFGPRSPLDDFERHLDPWWRTALSSGGGASLRRGCRVDGRLAGGVAAGRPSISSRLTDRNPLEYSADPDHLGGAFARGRVSGLVSRVGTAGQPAGMGGCRTIEGDQGDRSLGGCAAVGTPFRGRARRGDRCLSFTCCSRWPPLPRPSPCSDRDRPIQAASGRRGVWWLVAAWIVPGWLFSAISMRDATLEAEFLAVGHGSGCSLPDARWSNSSLRLRPPG